MKSKKYAYAGLMIALAFILSYVEFLIPINLGIPGVKLGLANLVVIVALYTVGWKDALLLSVIRIVLVGFTFGNLSSMLYSLGGGLLSYLIMIIARKTGLFSTRGVSALGGIFHNVGQILIAMLVLETSALIYYLPVLLIAGTISGVLIGILAAMIIERIKRFEM
jgi:heptaprenyl diphosphate synthase